MPEISFQTLQENKTRAEAERIVNSLTRPIGSFKRTVAVTRLFIEAKKEVALEVGIQHSGYSQKSMRVCPECGRTVKAVNGRILSHREGQKANGYGMGAWCKEGQSY